MKGENTCQKFQVLPMRFLHRVPKRKKSSGRSRIAAVRGEGGVPFSKRTFLDVMLLRTKPKSGPLEKIQIVFE
jgi:hypothetical protein